MTKKLIPSIGYSIYMANSSLKVPEDSEYEDEKIAHLAVEPFIY